MPETGGVDALQKEGSYSTHQRNKTSNNLHSGLTLDQGKNQYIFQSRDDMNMKKYFGSFKGSSQSKKSFIAKNKPQSKPKCKKRSRNKHMYIGMTSNQSKYTSKFPKNSFQEGNELFTSI